MAQTVCPSSTVIPPSNICHRLSLAYICIQSIRQEVSLNCESRREKIYESATKEMRTRSGMGE